MSSKHAGELGTSPASSSDKRVTIGGRESYAPRSSAMEMSFSATRLKPGGSLHNLLEGGKGPISQRQTKQSVKEDELSLSTTSFPQQASTRSESSIKAHFYKRSKSGKFQRRKFALRRTTAGLDLLYLDATGETNIARVLGASVTNAFTNEFTISTPERAFRLRAAQRIELQLWMEQCATCVGPAVPQTSTKQPPATAARAPLNQRGERKCLNILNVFFSLAVLVLTIVLVNGVSWKARSLELTSWRAARDPNRACTGVPRGCPTPHDRARVAPEQDVRHGRGDAGRAAAHGGSVQQPVGPAVAGGPPWAAGAPRRPGRHLLPPRTHPPRPTQHVCCLRRVATAVRRRTRCRGGTARRATPPRRRRQSCSACTAARTSGGARCTSWWRSASSSWSSRCWPRCCSAASRRGPSCTATRR